MINLSDIATYKQGKQIDISEQKTEPFKDCKRFIRIVDYTNPNEPIRYVKDPGKQYHVSKKDLVMIRYGSQTAGKVVRGIEGIIANNMFKIFIKDNYNLDYLYYYLSRDEIYNLLRSKQASSTMPAITFDMMNSIKLDIPTPEVQNHIVDTIKNEVLLCC